MFPALHKKFIIFTPSLASAFPQAASTTISTATTTQTSTALSLPTALQVLVPQCARSCFRSILFDEWPLGCASSGDLECLCSQYSTTGLTLGEAAYGCAFTSCSSSVSGLAATYGICSGQDGAVTPTHSTLTFTAHTTSTTASAASSTLISSIHVTNTTSTRNSSTSSRSSSRTSSSSTLDTSTAAASTTSEAASPTTSQSSASSSAAAAAAASSSDHGSGLSTAQIVGISVASVAAVALAAGVLFLLACLRRRDRKKEEEAAEKQGMSAFALTPPSHDSVAISPSAMAQFPSPPRNRRDPRNGAGVGTGGITVPQVRVVDPSPPRHQRAPTPLESIGLAITEYSPAASAASFSSSRTASQLLPDKPEPVYPRKPLPVPKSPVPTSTPFIEKKKKRDSSMSQATLFEEDTAVRKSMYPVRAVQVPPRQDAPAKVPPVRPYRPPPSFAEEYTESPVENSRQPSLSVAIPPQGRQITRQPTPSPPPIPSPLRIGVARPPNVAKPPLPLYHPPAALPATLPPDPHSSSASSGSTKFTGTNSTASSSYIPAYYTSPPTSIMQTPPESYRNATSDAGGFSGPQQAPLGHSSSTSRPSPQRQAQTSATAPQSTHMHQTPAAVSAVAQNRGVPPQPSLAHLPGRTTGQQAPAPLQGSQANPPALRQQPPPQPPVGQAVPAAARHDHQQQQDQSRQAPPPVPSAANHRNGPLPWSSSTPSSSAGQPTANQYHAYRPPLPPQPRSPPRQPRQTARLPLAKGPQRSTSSASMTSFESASPGDPSPPPEDESDTSAKQLGGGVGLDASHSHHPHATVTAPASSSTLRLNTTPPQHSDGSSVEDKSPISDIKYPKVPRASNQAVPRTSPNSGPRTATPSPRVQQQHHEGDDGAGGSNGSPKGGLQARRRGHEGNGLLIINSGANTPPPPMPNSTTPPRKAAAAGGRSPHTPQGQIIRGDGAQQLDHDPDQARKSSAALPPDQQQANWPGRQGGGQGDVAIKTPMWAPKLTPTRHGDDMYLAVAYASKEGISG